MLLVQHLDIPLTKKVKRLVKKASKKPGVK